MSRKIPMNLQIQKTPISQVEVIQGSSFQDARGAFSRFFCEQELAAVIGERRIVQINHSRTSTVGAIRGLHYQHAPHAEMKLVRCIKGRVWDVAVDLRRGSQTFLQWHAVELSPENGCVLAVPEGCAHGFQVLEAESEMLYLHTAFYMPESEGGIVYNDPSVNIAWPLPVTDLSDGDHRRQSLPIDFSGISV